MYQIRTCFLFAYLLCRIDADKHSITIMIGADCMGAKCIELREYFAVYQLELSAKSDENTLLKVENVKLQQKYQNTKKMYTQIKDVFFELKIKYDKLVSEPNGCDDGLDIPSPFMVVKNLQAAATPTDELPMEVDNDRDNMSIFASEQSNSSYLFESGIESDMISDVDMTDETSNDAQSSTFQQIPDESEFEIVLSTEDIENVTTTSNINLHDGRSSQKRFRHLICYKCYQKFATQVALGEHKKQKCGQIQNTKSNTKNLSVATVDSLNALQQFRDRGARKNRSLAAATPNGGRYICQHINCGKQFSRKGTLNTHKWIHNENKRFECNHPKCGRQFTYRHYLVAHLRVHSGEKPFACEVAGCDKRYTQKSALNTHMFVHDSAKACTRCRRHGDNMSGGNGRSSGTKKKKCDENYRPTTQRVVKIENQSNNPRFAYAYACNELNCGRGFSRECTLKAHLKRHSQDDFY